MTRRKYRYNAVIVVFTTPQLHSTKSELRFLTGSNRTRGVSEICNGEDLWKWSRLEIGLKDVRWSTIPQKQFIIIFIVIEQFHGFNSNMVTLEKRTKFVKSLRLRHLNDTIDVILMSLLLNKSHDIRILSLWFLNLLFAVGLSLAIRQQCGKISVQSQQQRYWNNIHRHVFINDFENAFFYRVISHGLWYFSVKINPFMHVGKWPDRLLKVLQRSHHNILKVSVTIFQYYAWKG